MTEVADLSPTDASNTTITGQSLEGNVANMGSMDDTLQALLGMLGRWTSSDTLASAATTEIGAQAEAYLTVSGTTTITAFGTIRAGTMRFLRFSGILTLTHNAASLILPGAANITTAAGDTAVFVSEGSGNWRCIAYQRASAFYSRPQAWEHIETKVISIAAATADFIGLAAFRQLRLTGYALPATDAASLWARTSTDNGATYLDTSTYTNQVLVASDTAVGGARSTNTAILLSNSTGFDSGEGSILNAFVTQFNVNDKTVVQNSGGGLGPTGALAMSSTLGTSPAAVNNALRIMFSSGNIAAGGYLVLEGVRG